MGLYPEEACKLKWWSVRKGKKRKLMTKYHRDQRSCVLLCPRALRGSLLGLQYVVSSRRSMNGPG
jgi:hypothetical protein